MALRFPQHHSSVQTNARDGFLGSTQCRWVFPPACGFWLPIRIYYRISIFLSLYDDPILTPLLGSTHPEFHGIDTCPEEQMLGNRNTLHRSKLVLVSWLVLAYLLVKHWQLTGGPWRKYPVQILDEVCFLSFFFFFPKQFFWERFLLEILEFWGGTSTVPTWKSVWGLLHGCRCFVRIQTYP